MGRLTERVRSLCQGVWKSLYRWLWSDVSHHRRPHNGIPEYELLRTLRALQKFLRDHNYGAGQTLAALDASVKTLETDDFYNMEKAFAHFDSIPMGAFGAFDWIPPVVYEHEDEDYVRVVFESLVDRTYRLMRTAAGVPLGRRTRRKRPAP
jgi:hypothetical protein